MNNLQPPSLVSITVSGGSGSKGVSLGGKLISYGIKPPSELALYDIDINDPDGFGIVGSSGLTGTTTVNQSAQLYGTNTIAISNASIDGTYLVKLWWD